MAGHIWPMSRSLLPAFGSDGFSILELATVLLLMGLSVGSLLPAARHQLDRMAVLGAREEVAGLFHRARFEAVAQGGSALHLDSRVVSVTLSAGGVVLDQSGLADEYGISLTLSSGRLQADLTFDPLGLGRVASQTLRFRRGRAETALVVSSFGRIVRE